MRVIFLALTRSLTLKFEAEWLHHIGFICIVKWKGYQVCDTVIFDLST